MKAFRALQPHVYELSTRLCVGGGADGGPANRSDGSGMCDPTMPICLPCWPGCRSCQDGTPCWVQEAWLLRAGVLAIQGVFMFLIFVSMLVAYRHRRNRVSSAFGAQLNLVWGRDNEFFLEFGVFKCNEK